LQVNPSAYRVPTALKRGGVKSKNHIFELGRADTVCILRKRKSARPARGKIKLELNGKYMNTDRESLKNFILRAKKKFGKMA